MILRAEIKTTDINVDPCAAPSY